MSFINAIVKILPTPIAKIIQESRIRGECPEYRDLSTQQAFTKIYKEHVWGKPVDQSQEFFSGGGSQDTIVVETYLTAIHKFLDSFEKKPDVTDLGCGDFYIGSKIRHLCQNYIACDIVEPLINSNTEKYSSLDVDFRILDLTKDELPKADVVFIRQVFQHLSNNQIKSALPQIASNYRYLVLTEHLPIGRRFIHNLDKPTGPNNRLRINSGVVLTSKPFSLEVADESQLCQILHARGIIATTLYKFN